MDKRLFLHVGSFKTGSTAIQGFLQSNSEALAGAGLNYVQAGRTNIAHNSMIAALKKNNPARVCDQIAREIELSPASIHVVSSEMFFRQGVAEQLGAHMPAELKSRTTVVAYIRRQDKYLEALYKQLVKNGRFPPNPRRFHNKRLESLAYSKILGSYADQFGIDNLIVRPFERQNFQSGDVVSDFLDQTGVILPEAFEREPLSANKTFSAPLTEMLGMLSRQTDINTRELIRILTRQATPGAIRSNDVFDLATRRAMVARHAADNAFVQQTYCPDLDILFDTSDLEKDPDPFPTPAQQVENWRFAAQAMSRALGELRKPKS